MHSDIERQALILPSQQKSRQKQMPRGGDGQKLREALQRSEYRNLETIYLLTLLLPTSPSLFG
jgi:hypothetical protein